MMLKLLLASQNQGKLREMKFILQDLPIQIISPAELGIHLDVEENGKTYAENAALKAHAWLSCESSNGIEKLYEI